MCITGSLDRYRKPEQAVKTVRAVIDLRRFNG